jgi:hypothetical protein
MRRGKVLIYWFELESSYEDGSICEKEAGKNSCASPKVATAGGAIGGRAGTGGHYQF